MATRTPPKHRGPRTELEKSEAAYNKWVAEMGDQGRKCRAARRHLNVKGLNELVRVSDEYYWRHPQCECGWSQHQLVDAETLTIVERFRTEHGTDYLKPPEAKLARPGQVPVAVFRRELFHFDERPKANDEQVAAARVWLQTWR